MPRDYIPSTDAGKLTHAQNMVALITPAATDWNLTAGFLTTLTGYVTDYATKLSAATEPATKSRANTFAKDQARDLMVRYIREVVVPCVQGGPQVTDQMKYDLGITVRGLNPPTPIGPPTEVPVASILSVDGWRIKVQIKVADSPKRGLPVGCAGINIYSYVGAAAPADPLEWTYEGESSKSRFEVEIPAGVPAGSKVWLTFCFKSPRFQTGPACAGVPVIIGGGVPETNVG